MLKDNILDKNQLKIASPGRRLGAYLIDGGVWMGLMLGMWLWIVFAATVENLMSSLAWVLVIFMLVFPLGSMLYTAGMTAGFGGTIGKLLMGIEIVNLEGKRIGFWRAFFRNVIGYAVSGMALWLGFIWILLDKPARNAEGVAMAGRQGWHDMMAGTVVVEKRKTGLLTGAIGLIGIIGVIAIMGIRIAGQVKQNLPFYQEMMGDIMQTISETKR